MDLKQGLVKLYRKAATRLPEDIALALERAGAREESQLAREVIEKILLNAGRAMSESKPICQDTGTPIFYVNRPANMSEARLRDAIAEATDIATREVPLRPNAVDCVSGKNIGNIPVIHFEESQLFSVDLMLKGGGSENVSAAYQLPNQEINADRDLKGVRKCVLDAVFRAQGRGCPPYIIGVGLAGSLEEAAHLSKKQLLRSLADSSPAAELRAFEGRVLNEVNSLGIGPLGLGGKTTALGLKIASAPRHPASFFVGVSLGCWCMRRQSL